MNESNKASGPGRAATGGNIPSSETPPPEGSPTRLPRPASPPFASSLTNEAPVFGNGPWMGETIKVEAVIARKVREAAHRRVRGMVRQGHMFAGMLEDRASRYTVEVIAQKYGVAVTYVRQCIAMHERVASDFKRNCPARDSLLGMTNEDGTNADIYQAQVMAGIRSIDGELKSEFGVEKVIGSTAGGAA